MEQVERESEELRAEVGRTERENEELRSLKVWAGYPCAVCGGPLRGEVPRETAQWLLKNFAHTECLAHRWWDRASTLPNWGFGPQLHEAN